MVLLASTIWMAAIATAAMDGMVPDPVNWDHAPRPEPTQGSGAPSAHPDDLPWQGYNWYDPNNTVTKSPDPKRDPGADPPAGGDRSSKFFTLKEVRAAVHRVQGHPMFDTAVVRRVKATTGGPIDSAQAPADVAALVWKELKLDNNPQLAEDPALREQALGMVGEIAAAFHKPDPLLRPILNRDGSELQVHVHTHDEVPLTSRMYRVSPDRLPAMRDKLNEMMEQGVIRRSHSSWSSPLVFVPKPPGADGTLKWRCTVDMRQLNKKTVPYKYPTPHIDDLILACGYTEPDTNGSGQSEHVAEDLVREINGVT